MRGKIPTSPILVPPSGDTTGVTDAANLNAAIIAAKAAKIGQINLGSGDYYMNPAAPIDFTEAYTSVRPDPVYNPDVLSVYGIGIILQGQGMYITRIRTTISGSLNNGGSTNGTLFRAYPLAAGTTSLFNQWFRDLSIYGPNSTPVVKSTVTFTSASSVLQMPDTSGLSVGMWIYDYKTLSIPVGTYISAIKEGVSVTMSSKTTASPPVAQAQTANASASGTNDGVATFYADSCAVQRGGVSTNKYDIVNGGGFENVSIHNFFTNHRADVTARENVNYVESDGCEYNTEMWFNCDMTTFRGGDFRGTRLSYPFTGTVSASANITALASTKSGLTALTGIRPGSKVADQTSLGFAAAVAVLTIDSATQVTLTAASSSTGTKTLSFHKGIGLAIGGGPWRPGFSGSGTGSNNIKFTDGQQFGQGMEIACYAPIDGLKPLIFEDCYTEGLYQLAAVGSVSGSGLCTVIAKRCHFSTADSIQAKAAIECLTTAGSPGPTFVIENCDNDGTMNRPWVRYNTGATGSVILDYNNNSMIMRAAGFTWQDSVFPQGTPNLITNGTRLCLGMGPNAGSAVTSQSVSGTMSQWIPRGVRKFIFSLTAATTLVTDATNTWLGMEDGQIITIRLTETGAGSFNFTFPAEFVNNDATTRVGTAGVITGGATGTSLDISYIVNVPNKLFIRIDGNGVTFA